MNNFEVKIELEQLRKRKIFLATPMYGGQCTGMFTRSVMDLSAMCAAHGIQLVTYYLFNESLITRARNYCADEFLRSDCTHLMQIDSDIGFNPHDVLALLAMMSDESPYDIVCGPYPKKCISWEKIKLAVDKGLADENPNALENFVGDFVFNPTSGQTQIPIGIPVEVSEAGTGFMMIRRKVFEKFKEVYPSLSYRPDHIRTAQFDGSREIHAFFDCIIDRGYTFDDARRLMVKAANGESVQKEMKELLSREERASKRYLSEDYNFCYLVRKFGGKVWLCPWMRLQHVGTYVFGGSLADLAAVGAPATADAGMLKKENNPGMTAPASQVGPIAEKKVLLPGLGGAPLK